jgi:hypothetical protein
MNGHLATGAIGKLLAFPVGGRRSAEKASPRPMLVNDNRQPQAPIFGDAWYHDAAIGEDEDQKGA